MLESGFKTEAERKEAIDSILMSSKTLLGLVNDVLDLSKLESGKMEILPEPTDCSRLMQVVVEAFRVSSGRPGVELRCRVGEMPLLMLDPQRLRQIMFNLVGNAVKFTAKGHVELRARFERRRDADTGVFRMEVEDTGCGISEEDLKRIGSAYVQVGSKVSRNGGTGLGLAICKQLVAAMGGELEVNSTLGAGSTFSVIIPNVKVAESKPDAQERVNPPADAQQSALPVQMPHRILLVDDSRMNLMVLKALLKNMGDFEITMAPDGQEALKVLEEQGAKAFDIVLTDMWMPNLDGAGLIRAIRANPALATLRVIAVTADVESRVTCADMGFNGILLLMAAEQGHQIIAGGDGGKAGYDAIGNEAFAQLRQKLAVSRLVGTGADDHEEDVRSGAVYGVEINRTAMSHNAEAHKHLLQSGDVSVRNRNAVQCGEADVAQGVRDDGRDHGVELVHGQAVLLENGLENPADDAYGGRLGDVADNGNGLDNILPLCIVH